MYQRYILKYITKFVPTCTKINILLVLCRTRVFTSHADIEIPPVSTKFGFLPLKKATLNQILAEIEGSTRTRIRIIESILEKQ